MVAAHARDAEKAWFRRCEPDEVDEVDEVDEGPKTRSASDEHRSLPTLPVKAAGAGGAPRSLNTTRASHRQPASRQINDEDENRLHPLSFLGSLNLIPELDERPRRWR